MKNNISKIRKERWRIVTSGVPTVKRNCSKCKEKREFINSMKFRVNANGKNVDVWLIYRCEKCSTSWNMAVYERSPVNAVPKEEYAGFLSNDRLLAEAVGRREDLFARNKAEVIPAADGYRVEEIGVEEIGGEEIRADETLVEESQTEETRTEETQVEEILAEESPAGKIQLADSQGYGNLRMIEMENPFPVALRLDSLLADQLGMSRSMVRRRCGQGSIFKMDEGRPLLEQGNKIYREKVRDRMVIGIRNTPST